MKHSILFLSLLVAASACARTPAPSESGTAAQQASSAAATATGSPAASASGAAASPDRAAAAESTPSAQVATAAALPLVVVHKSPTCGCCGLWIDHLREHGFQVEVRNADDLNPVKERVGVPYGKGSCHTAEVGGYFVEGHVPAEDIKRLLAEKPAAKGLVVPGMPLGSPGMEVPDGTVQAYTVELVEESGATRAFAQHGPGAQ